MSESPRVTVFYEDLPQPQQDLYEKTYPRGIGPTVAAALARRGLVVQLARMSEEECGLTDEVLERTDVMVWWTHKGGEADVQDRIPQSVSNRVYRRVLGGMGFIPLHSSFTTDVFQRLMGTSCKIYFRNMGEIERVWTIDPSHPIAKGVGRYIELEQEEMYGEDFDIPAPDELIFVSWFEGGDVFRSGCCWRRGRGRIFFFRPGHETAPTYHNTDIQQVIFNACLWAAPEQEIVPPRTHIRREPLS